MATRRPTANSWLACSIVYYTQKPQLTKGTKVSRAKQLASPAVVGVILSPLPQKRPRHSSCHTAQLLPSRIPRHIHDDRFLTSSDCSHPCSQLLQMVALRPPFLLLAAPFPSLPKLPLPLLELLLLSSLCFYLFITSTLFHDKGTNTRQELRARPTVE